MKAPYSMKARTIILSSVLLLINASLFSQEKKVALGLGISPSINWLSAGSEGIRSDGNIVGFNYGLLTDFNFGENYSLASGLFVNSFGGNLEETHFDTAVSVSNVKYKIQSILIPITIRMKTKEIGYLRYYGQFGFNPEYVINAKADIATQGGSSESDKGIMDEVGNFNFSLVLGIGIMYNLSGTTNFILGLSYNNGFINMLEGNAGAKNDVEKRATTKQIALNLGVLF